MRLFLQLPDGLRYQFIKATDKFVPLSVLHPSVQWEDLAAGVVNKIGDFCCKHPLRWVQFASAITLI